MCSSIQCFAIIVLRAVPTWPVLCPLLHPDLYYDCDFIARYARLLKYPPFAKAALIILQTPSPQLRPNHDSLVHFSFLLQDYDRPTSGLVLSTNLGVECDGMKV